MLNENGGIAADLTVSLLEEGDGSNPLQPKEGAFYLAIGGAIGQHAWGHIQDVLHEKKFNCKLTERSEDIGILSIQGPKRYVHHRSFYMLVIRGKEGTILLKYDNNVQNMFSRPMQIYCFSYFWWPLFVCFTAS